MSVEYPSGDYGAVVEEQAWQRAATGSRMLVLTVKPMVRFVEQGGKEKQEKVDGGRRTVRLVIASEKQAEFVIKKLRHAGAEFERWSEVDMVGAKIRCVVQESTWNGEAKEDWDLALPGRGPLQNVEEVALELDQEFPLTGAVAVGGGQRSSGPADDDEDIPF